MEITSITAAAFSGAGTPLAVCAVPAYGGRVPAPAVGKIARCAGDGTPAVLLVTFGNREIDDTMLELADLVEDRGFVPVGGAAVVAHHSLMTDVAEGRPDAGDLDAVDRLSSSVLEKLATAHAAAEGRLAGIPGGKPYREFGGTPFKAEADAGRCVGCGACARQCSVGAIDGQNCAATDAGLCISCTRCLSACPHGARRIGGGQALDDARRAFARAHGERKESWALV